MEARPNAYKLEVTVISGENIHIDRSPIAENVYVVVRADSLHSCTTKMLDENGGIFSWNEKFMLDVSMHARSITFEVQCKKYKGVRPIGVARIGILDFLSAIKNTSDEINGPQILSYGLRDWDGRRNGVLHLSAKVEVVEAAVAPVAPAAPKKNPRKFEHVVMSPPSMDKKKSNADDDEDVNCMPVLVGHCINLFKISFIFGFVRRRKVYCD